MQSNTCGNCTLCCTLLGVTELRKPPGTPCKHCTGHSCRIHDDPEMPETCHDFECGYLISSLPLDFRPDRCHIIITGEDEDMGCYFVHVDPKFPKAAESGAGKRLIDALLYHGKFPNILVVKGDGTLKPKVISRDPEGLGNPKQWLKKFLKSGGK